MKWSKFLHYNHIIVIGASAGGVNALKNLISPLPADFPAPIFVVMHVQAKTPSHLPDLINRYSKLPALHPINKQTIQAGHIYVAPPNVHMIISGDKIYLKKGPKINYSRPSIDALFYSAALYGSSTIGIVLTGMLNDGTAGLLTIKKHKGTTIIQDLEEAEFQSMPKNALKNAPIDYCLPTRDIASLLIKKVKTMADPIDKEN